MKQKDKRSFSGTVCVMAMALLMCFSLAGCNSGDGSDSTITLCESGDIVTMYNVVSPQSNSTFGIAYWTENLYDTLVAYNSENTLVGELAESWTISTDGTVYTFDIRDGVKFSDGTALTASAVKQSIDASLTNLGTMKGSYGKIGALITKTEAPDDDTFVLTLSSPYYSALNDLTFTVAYGIANPKTFEGGVEKAWENCESVSMGSGPYKFDSKTDNTYSFVYNDNYWGEKPEVEKFNIKIIADNSAKILALKSGEIDAIIGSNMMDFDGYSSLSKDSFITMFSESSSESTYLGLRVSDINVYNQDYTAIDHVVSAGVFKDEAVRKAAAYAIDQQTISTNCFNGFESAAETWFPLDKPYCNVTQTTYETNTAKAEELLTNAGWVKGADGKRSKGSERLSVKLVYSKSSSSYDNAALALESQLEAVGFDVEIDCKTDMMAWYYSAIGGEYDIMIWPSNGGAMDPSSTISNLSAGSADPILSGLYSFFPANTLETLDCTTSSEVVQDCYETILTTIADKSLLIPFSHVKAPVALNKSKIASYTYNYDQQYIVVANIELVK